jgi:hypothetical protein
MRRWSLAVTGLAYAISYLLLAIMTSGGGHGPRFTFAPAMPYGIGLLVFPVLGYLVGDLKAQASRAIFAILLIAHSAIVMTLVVIWWQEDLPYANRAWEASPSNILLPVLWYFCGLVFLWAMYIRGVLSNRRRHPTNAWSGLAGE